MGGKKPPRIIRQKMLSDMVKQHAASQALAKRDSGARARGRGRGRTRGSARHPPLTLCFRGPERRKAVAVASAQRVSVALVRNINAECAASVGRGRLNYGIGGG
jgi:hypothetical protein